MAADARFLRNADRFANEAQLRAAIEAWSETHNADDVVARCHAAEIPAGPVWDLAQAAGSAQVAARGLLRSVAHPVFGELKLAPQPAKFSRSTNAVLIARLAFDIPKANSTVAIVPKTTRVATFTIRPFARVFSTTA